MIKFDQRREQIKRILKNFDLNQIRKLDIEEVYYKFRKAFNVTSRDTKQNSWRKQKKVRTYRKKNLKKSMVANLKYVRL